MPQRQFCGLRVVRCGFGAILLNVSFQIIQFKTYRKWPGNQMFESQYKFFHCVECLRLNLLSDKTFNIGGALANVYCRTSVTIPNIEKKKKFGSPPIGF